MNIPPRPEAGAALVDQGRLNVDSEAMYQVIINAIACLPDHRSGPDRVRLGRAGTKCCTNLLVGLDTDIEQSLPFRCRVLTHGNGSLNLSRIPSKTCTDLHDDHIPGADRTV